MYHGALLPIPSQNTGQNLEIGVMKNLLLLYLSRIAVVFG